MTRYVVVTGTDTDVGKTIVTAALATLYRRDGTVAVVKPTQTGIGPGDDEPADVDVVRSLAGVEVHELVRLPEPLAPDTAARRAGVELPPVAEQVARIRGLGADMVLVEGAGGLLVRLDGHGGTVIDVAAALAAEVHVVTRPGLGTLNHTELTVRALRERDIEPAGLVIGAWPPEPDLAQRCNLEDLPRVTGCSVVGVVPSGVGGWRAEEFAAAAPGWFG